MKLTRMVIHCASGLKNSGDEAILSQLIHCYGKKFQITVISLNREYTKKLHPGIDVISPAYSESNRAIRECDLFVLGGGGLLQDTTSIYCVARWLSKLKLALKYHKKTCVYANSVGPLKYRFNRFLVKKYLSKVDCITLRDEISFRLLQSLGVTENVTVTADPVFSFEGSEINEKKSLEKYGLSDKYVGIAIRHWYDTIPFIPVSICTKYRIKTRKNKKLYDKYISELRKTVCFINDKLKMPVCFVSFCFSRDAVVARDVLNTTELINFNRIIDDEFITPEETMAIVRNSEFLLGMRLHSIIYAINAGVPVIPVIYEEKVKGIIEATGLKKYSINISELECRQIQKKIQLLSECASEQSGIEQAAKKNMQEKERLNREYIMKLI